MLITASPTHGPTVLPGAQQRVGRGRSSSRNTLGSPPLSPAFHDRVDPSLNSLPAKSRLRPAAEQLERAVLAGGIGPDKYPVLPRREPSEDLGFEGFVARKPQAG